MARSGSQIRITRSVLDRLIDNEPGIISDGPESPLKSLRELKGAVRRDLEWLLNTRRSIAKTPPAYEQTARSLAVYGLPDFTAAGLKSPSVREYIRRTIQEAVRLFEPRLIDVSVSLDRRQGSEHALRFRIDGRLRIDPEPEPVTFDTTLQVSSGEYEVKAQE